MPRWKTRQINSIINPVNFRRGIRAALAKQLEAIIGFGSNELGSSADFAKEIIAAKILHEILSVGCYAEWNA